MNTYGLRGKKGAFNPIEIPTQKHKLRKKAVNIKVAFISGKYNTANQDVRNVSVGEQVGQHNPEYHQMTWKQLVAMQLNPVVLLHS